MKLMSRIIPHEMNTPDANELDTRLDARSVLVDKSRSSFSLASRVVAMFLSRRNKIPIPQSTHVLLAREGGSKDDQIETSSSTNEKNTNGEAKLSSENTKERGTANAGSQKNSSEKATTDRQKENGAKSAAENKKSLSNTDNLVSGSPKPSNSTGSLVSEAQKSPINSVGLVSESQKSSNSTASTGPKSPKNPSDAGKSASDGRTNGANEAQEDLEKDKNKKTDISKEKSNGNADRNKSTQGKSPAPVVNSTNGKDTSNKDVKNAVSPSPAPKNELLPPISAQEPATADNKDPDPEGANTEKNNLLTADELEKNQASSSLENNIPMEKTDLDEIDHSTPSLGTDLPSNDPNLGVTQLSDKGFPTENLKDIQPSSLTSSAKASLDSEIPRISAKQSTYDNSHSDIVKWIFSIFGILLFLTIIIYIIRLCLRYRRLGKAESPPPSPLINRMEPMQRGFSNNRVYDKDLNNSSNNFYPFYEEERLRTMEMNKTYGRVI